MKKKGKKALCALILLLIVVACIAAAAYLYIRPGGVQTYLVIGMDNYGSLAENGRNDVTMLVQIDFDGRRISAATFARDMFVENENGYLTKINTIVKGKGEDGLVDAVERNFGVEIDGWFRINFSSVIELVDAIGGADVVLTGKEAAYIDKAVGKYDESPLEEGVCHLNGAQALAYARCRKLDNDLGRGERQTKLVAALVEQTKRVSAKNIMDIFDTLGHAWTSSLSGGEQAKLLSQALWLRGADVARIAVPFDGYWRYGENKSGTSGIVADIEDNRAMLLAALGIAPAPQAEE